MDGGHRDEDDPLDPPNRLDRLDRLDLFLDQQQQHYHQQQLAQLDIARLNLDGSHSLLPQPPSDHHDARLDDPSALASSFHLAHHEHPIHLEHLHRHHQHNLAAHALQPSLLPAFDVQPSPQPSSHAGVGSSQFPSTSTASQLHTQPQPFPPFPTHDDDATAAVPDELPYDDPGAFYRSYADDNHLRRLPQNGQETAVAISAADLMASEAPVAQPPPPPPASAPSLNSSPNGLTAQQLLDAHQQQQQHQHQHQHQPRSRPPPSLANRANAIRSNRSVSSPVGSNGSNASSSTRPGYGAAGSSATSVKDLKKRFDQINSSGPTATTAGSFNSSIPASSRLKPTARAGLTASSSTPSTMASRSRATTAAGSSTATASTASSRAKTPTGRNHPPPPLSSPNSFASRIAKPRAGGPATFPVSVNEQGSRSTPSLTSPLASPRAARMVSPPPPPPPVTRPNGLLFGEILPKYNNSVTTGYGIDAAVARPRRTSESVLHNPPRIFTRSRSEMEHDVEAVSPTDWYRSATSPRTAADFDAQAAAQAPIAPPPPAAASTASRIPTGHSRAHSDLAGAKPTYHHYQHLQHQQHSQHNALAVLPPPPSHPPPPARLDTTQPSNSSSRPPTSMSDMPQSPTSPTSRLPISVRKLSAASGRSSPSSTRSDSSASAAGRRSAAASSRVPRHQQPHGPPPSSANAKAPTKRAATPTSTAAARTKPSGPTPSSSRRPPPSQIATPSNNGRLNAYIAAPPPKLSPPLRSSRPRQPVSSANASSSSASRFGRTSAASSSSSTAERTRAPGGHGSSRTSANRQDEGRANRRKIDVGPIDFAQRRETIRLKYSKSIRETEASAARQAAAERRKKELEAAAKAKALAEAAVRAQSEVGRRAMAASAAVALSTKSSASSLSAMSNAAASSAAAVSAAAAVTRSLSVRSSVASIAANMAILAASSPSPTASRFPDTSTPPPTSPTAATAAAAANAAISSPPRNSPHQSPRSSPSLRRKISIRKTTVEPPPSLTITTAIPELKPAPSGRVPQKEDSPTLGIPGTFPGGGVYSPPAVDANNEPPPSAISVGSAITEFDNEPQTEPPHQDLSGNLQRADDAARHSEQPQQLQNGPLEKKEQQDPRQQEQDQDQEQPIFIGLAHDKVEYHSPFELPTPEDQVAQPSQHATPHQQPSQRESYGAPKAQYMYPFEDESLEDVTPMANNTAADQPREADLSPFDRFIPGSYRQDSYESRPYTPPQDRDDAQAPEQLTTVLHQSPMQTRELRRIGSHQQIETERLANEEGGAASFQVSASSPCETDDMAGQDNAIGIAVTSVSALDEEDNEPTMPSRNFEPEYEVQPFRPDDRKMKTTVTILGRETDVSSRRPSLSRLNSSSSRLGAANDAESDNNAENLYAVPSLKDNIATLRGSTFAASDISDEPQRSERSTGEPQRTPDTSNSLNLPSIMSPANRSSQQSGWTDFSIESEDARAFIAARDAAAPTSSHGDLNISGIDNNATIRARAIPPSLLQSQPALQHQGRHRNPYEFDSRPTSILEDDKEQGQLQDDNYDGAYEEEGSPDSESMLPPDEEPTSTMLPELDTGTHFFIPYLSDDKATGSHIPVLPDHDPPPIPVSVDGRDSFTENSVRPSSSSAYYDSSRPNSFALGMRDDHDGQDSFTFGGNGSADDSMFTSPPPTMMMQSSAQASLDLPRQSIGGATLIDSERPSGLDGAADGYDDGDAPPSRTSSSPRKKAAPSKEQTRLVQRQMVIRELVDTEAVFVRDMNIVEEIYKGTAEACPQLDANTVKLIFRNTDEIIAFHTAFLVQLKDAVSTVYAPKGGRRSSPPLREDSIVSEPGTLNSTSAASAAETTASTLTTAATSTTASISEDARDRQTSLGPVFRRNIDQMRITHEAFLRSSDNAAKRLIQIQEDPTVKLWLSECNEVAQDLTAAWNLDSLLIKPMQRITKYPNLISQLLQYTPEDHPDRAPLMSARTTLENAIVEINKTKKNFELVGQIVGRKRKDSDVRAGFARAFGKRVDKLQVSSNRPPEDQAYTKLNEKFGDDYLRLQVVLRDVEFYTRQVSAYVHEFLQLLSAMELVMRLQPSPYPELESKWARFNVSMRDMEKVALEQHLAQVRKHVIEPFELVIKCYGNPSLAMKKRAKRRLDYERAVQLKKSGKKVDKQLAELVEQYEALNEALKKELPKLSANTEKIGNICLGSFVNIQVRWFAIWKEKVKVVLEDQQNVPEVVDIMSSFARDFKDMEEHMKQSLTILTKGTGSMDLGSPSPGGTSGTGGTGMLRTRSGRPADLSPRTRGESVNSDSAPTLPTPDFGGRSSGQFAFSPTSSSSTPTVTGLVASASIASAAGMPNPHPHHQFYYRGDYYSGLNLSNGGHARGSSGSPITPGMPTESSSMRSLGSASASHGGYAAGGNASSGRPSTGRSYDSSGNTAPRPSVDSLNYGLPAAGQSSMAAALQASKRDSASTYNSNNQYPPGSTTGGGGGGDNSSMTGSGGGGRRFSGLFHSAMPMDDAPTPTAASYSVRGGGGGGGSSSHYLMADDASRLSSRASSRERAGTTSSNASSTTGGGNASGYNVLWLAASLFEFNIETKHEAGYPYLTYQAGEIFDVIAEKGELWLAKNQDDPNDLVGWIWSKHFAKLADS
ncbi:hypothetical protein SCUCBS95973_003740 [Sporothrix curviconia]|uniref:DH domain-containing protein n=1 Tax=Sporothrix curviconia TaxID=1260050 RepID=A0ABP0BHV6_9PEZI